MKSGRGFSLIKVHTRKYCLVNPENKFPKFLYDEECPVYYAPGLDRFSRIRIRLPDYITTKLSLSHDGSPAYASGSDLEDAEKKLEKYNDQVREMLQPRVKKKVIHFRIDPDRLAITHEVFYLVDHGCGSHYSTENLDGTVASNWIREIAGFNHIDWTEEREKWFKEVEKILMKIEREVHTMLLKPNYDNDGKLTGYGYLKGEDITAMIDAKVFPLNYKIFPMIEAPKEEKS